MSLPAATASRFDLDRTPGDATPGGDPHPEIIGAVSAGHELLIDDGKMRLTVVASGEGLGRGPDPDRRALRPQGVNVPSVTLPLSAMTDKDHADLLFGLRLGVDPWRSPSCSAPRT